MMTRRSNLPSAALNRVMADAQIAPARAGSAAVRRATDASRMTGLAIVIEIAEPDSATYEAIQALAGDFASLVTRLTPHATARVAEGPRRAAPSGSARPASPPSGRAPRELLIDFAEQQVRIDGRAIELAHKEFQVLALLALRPSRVVSREELMGAIWRKSDEQPAPRTVDVYIQRIRSKLGAHRRAIVTVRGSGYRFHAGPHVKLHGVEQLFAGSEHPADL